MPKFSTEDRPTHTEFKPGDARIYGNRGRGRPSKLDDPDFVKFVAALFVEGRSREEMKEECGVSVSTITLWRRDTRVKAQAKKLIEERLSRVVNRLDAVLEWRVMKASDDLTVDELIKIRRELFGGKFRQEIEGNDEGTVGEAMNAIEEDPELVTKLQELLRGAKAEEPSE